VPLLAGTLAVVVLFGRRLLPERTARVLPPDLSRHAHTLAEEYLLEDGLFRLRVRPGSPYVGRGRAALDLATTRPWPWSAYRAGAARPTGRSGSATSSSSGATPRPWVAWPPTSSWASARRRTPTPSRPGCLPRRSGLAEVVIGPAPS
jgi:hypothetical protein